MKTKKNYDPFWVTEDNCVVYRGVPVALSGREFGLTFRLSMLKEIEYGKQILSIGCGIGADLKALKKDNCFTLGVDPERNFLNQGKNMKNADGFVNAIGENLPLGDESFDLVLLFEVLEHVINPKATLKEIYRILKPNGLLFLTVPNRFFIFETHGAKISKSTVFLGGIGVPFFSMMPRFVRRKFERARIYDQAEVTWLLRSSGFDAIRIEYLMPPLDILTNNHFVFSLRKCFLRLSKIRVVRMAGANIMVLSRKRTS